MNREIIIHAFINVSTSLYYKQFIQEFRTPTAVFRLIGDDRPLLGLIDYIHLNPVRAKVCPLSELKSYKLSSYPKYFKRTIRSGLCRERFLEILGLPDSLVGMRRYAEHLQLCEEADPESRDKLAQLYCRGWFIGSKEEKKALSEDLNEKHPDVNWQGSDLKEFRVPDNYYILIKGLTRWAYTALSGYFSGCFMESMSRSTSKSFQKR